MRLGFRPAVARFTGGRWEQVPPSTASGSTGQARPRELSCEDEPTGLCKDEMQSSRPETRKLTGFGRRF